MIGVDEVGRGCLAGPLLVVAARQLYDLPVGLDDSKKLPRKVRENLFELLIKVCEFGEGWVSCSEIDKLGLTAATRLGTRRALSNLQVLNTEHIIIDGHINFVSPQYKNAEALVRADALLPIVSAASVYAKVKRDAYMRELTSRFPEYGFESHVGYGTRQHIRAIQTLGLIKNLHRISFSAVRAADL